MSAHVAIDETPTGWAVVVTDGDDVAIVTDGPAIIVTIKPDADDEAKPLAVTLATASA